MRDPSLRDKPLGITQKYLLATSNYPARAAGVTKLQSIKEALKRCPDLVRALRPGAALSPPGRLQGACAGPVGRAHKAWGGARCWSAGRTSRPTGPPARRSRPCCSASAPPSAWAWTRSSWT